MVKLFWLVALGCIAWRMYTGRWPWWGWSQNRLKPRPPFALVHARQLLGLDAAASRKDILDAHRRRLAAIHPDRGGSNEQVHEANAARDLLLAALPGETPD